MGGAKPSPAESFGSYTTARVHRGRVERLERHVRRLRRDAARLGLPQPDPRAVERCFLDAAQTAFGDGGDGIVRVEWACVEGAPPQLIATPREVGDVPNRWRARTSQTPHPGLEARCNTKFVAVDAYTKAREESLSDAVNEVLLYDADGYLVEGGHSNFIVVDADGRLLTPALELGGVEGLGLTIVWENQQQMKAAKLTRADVSAARELMSVNGVRGVVPIVELDGEPLADGQPGPWAARLSALFLRS